MTYIKALAIWKQKSGHKGISPKKGTEAYEEVMKIMREHKAWSNAKQIILKLLNNLL